MLERELTAPHVQLHFEAWPISAHMHWHSYAPRVLHFSGSIYLCRFAHLPLKSDLYSKGYNFDLDEVHESCDLVLSLHPSVKCKKTHCTHNNIVFIPIT